MILKISIWSRIADKVVSCDIYLFEDKSTLVTTASAEISFHDQILSEVSENLAPSSSRIHLSKLPRMSLVSIGYSLSLWLNNLKLEQEFS